MRLPPGMASLASSKPHHRSRERLLRPWEALNLPTRPTDEAGFALLAAYEPRMDQIKQILTVAYWEEDSYVSSRLRPFAD